MKRRVGILPSNQWNPYAGHPGVYEGPTMKDVADYMAKELVRQGHDARVFWYMPAKGSSNIPLLHKMVDECNAWGATHAISPHTDAGVNDQKMTGILSIVYSDARKPWGEALAKQLGQRSGFGYRDTWTRSGFIVLGDTSCPAMILECGEHGESGPEAQHIIDSKELLGVSLAESFLVSVGESLVPQPDPEPVATDAEARVLIATVQQRLEEHMAAQATWNGKMWQAHAQLVNRVTACEAALASQQTRIADLEEDAAELQTARATLDRMLVALANRVGILENATFPLTPDQVKKVLERLALLEARPLVSDFLVKAELVMKP